MIPPPPHGNPSQSSYTVTFDSAGGSAVAPRNVTQGYTLTAPAAPTKDYNYSPAGAGLHTGDINEYTFVRWLKPDNTAWNFATDTVTGDITLTAHWEAPAIVSTVPVNDINAAFIYANANPGKYTLLINDNISVSTIIPLNVADVDLTIIGVAKDGIGGVRTISTNSLGALFSFQAPGVSLTLGQNIKLTRTTTANATLIGVNNGSLTMLAGSFIEDCTTSINVGTVININGSTSSFTMNGGTITGNTTNNNNMSNSSGGVRVFDGGTFVMTGGEITGNTIGPVTDKVNRDVLVQYPATFIHNGGFIGVLHEE